MLLTVPVYTKVRQAFATGSWVVELQARAEASYMPSYAILKVRLLGDSWLSHVLLRVVGDMF